MEPLVRDVMTPRPATVPVTATINQAARVMAAQDAGPLPIVDGERLVGRIADRDLVVRVLAESRSPADTPVGEVASSQIVTIAPSALLSEAGELFARHQIRRVPVENSRLLGIIRLVDVAQHGPPALTAQAVETIASSDLPGAARAAPLDRLGETSADSFPASDPLATR